MSGADLLKAVSGDAVKEKKVEGHWIGRFTRDEYRKLCGVFGTDYVQPKYLKALLMGLTTGKVALYDPTKYDLIEK